MRTARISLLSLWLIACGPPKLELAAGTTCAKTTSPGPTSASLLEALGTATRGTCVVAAPAKYTGSFTVPDGVILGAETGAVVEFTGDAVDRPAVTLGAGATLTGLRINGAPGVGISAGGGSQLINVQVQASIAAGLIFWCEDDCRTFDPAWLSNVELTNNAVGLIVHGARVTTEGGKISGNQSDALASGYGVVASHGADLQMTGTLVEDNQVLGVLVDGARDTNVSLAQVTVQNNRGRGVWAQGMLGTLGVPRLRLNGCVVEGNRLVGVGTRGSRGVVIEAGTVGRTALAQTSDGNGGLISVGDGIGLFANSSDVQVAAVTLSGNERSQVLVDRGSTALVVERSTITPTGTQLGVVVQNTVEVVQAPMIVTPQMGQELPVSAPMMGLPVR